MSVLLRAYSDLLQENITHWGLKQETTDRDLYMSILLRAYSGLLQANITHWGLKQRLQIGICTCQNIIADLKGPK